MFRSQFLQRLLCETNAEVSKLAIFDAISPALPSSRGPDGTRCFRMSATSPMTSLYGGLHLSKRSIGSPVPDPVCPSTTSLKPPMEVTAVTYLPLNRDMSPRLALPTQPPSMAFITLPGPTNTINATPTVILSPTFQQSQSGPPQSGYLFPSSTEWAGFQTHPCGLAQPQIFPPPLFQPSIPHSIFIQPPRTNYCLPADKSTVESSALFPQLREAVLAPTDSVRQTNLSTVPRHKFVQVGLW
ncbi:unnamed protein product [Protopolystoma xenopodis]|uniref:Uncharacterized protein n=1 Tax=Protopolystoma xenopodis TaxID=117903 RepID=A0A448X3K4_9PLAT|nr:unnamed protein product [Protopolystoma xenopodis]